MNTKDRLSGSASDDVVHLVVLVRGGAQLRVSGSASKPPETLPYQLPPPGTAGLNEYEIVGLAKSMERVYSHSLSSQTTWDIRDCAVDPWPPIAKITAIGLANGECKGLPFEDSEKYWLDIRFSNPRAFREVCWCAIRERAK